MALDSKHPSYVRYADAWRTMGDTYDGEDTVKAARTRYLPATAGMYRSGFGKGNPDSPGDRAYNAYLMRAIFHDFVWDSTTTLTGVVHRKPAEIKLPTALEPLRERATVRGESLRMLHRKVTAAQLLMGRFGMLLDVAQDARVNRALPYISTYSAASMINWDTVAGEDGRQVLSLMVLDESAPVMDTNLDWNDQAMYRVVANTQAVKALFGEVGIGTGEYHVGRAKSVNKAELEWVTPQIPGGKPLASLPFIVVNTIDLVPEPERPPLLGLAKLALAIYRSEADHRQQLFQQAQDTLVTRGALEGEEEGKPLALGVGGRLAFASTEGGAEFIGTSGVGLQERREQMNDDKTRAASKGSQLLDQRSKQVESGESLSQRESAKAVTLVGIVEAGAEALQRMLRHAAEWVGANPDEVEVVPNMDFAEAEVDFAALSSLTDAVSKGYPLSAEDLHAHAVKAGLTTTTFEEYVAAKEADMTRFGLDGGAQGDPDPTGGKDPEDEKQPAA